MTALLELDKVEQALRRPAGGASDLSFDVREREILGLIGPNGAGKSTLFNLINGVFAPDTGRIVFARRRYHRRPALPRRARTGSPARIRSCSRSPT